MNASALKRQLTCEQESRPYASIIDSSSTLLSNQKKPKESVRRREGIQLWLLIAGLTRWNRVHSATNSNRLQYEGEQDR
jgi:hypothetical protein